MADEKRVLSIHSTVVFGYVGNKSATFPLQLLGYDVSPINSVQVSNHTEYGSQKGRISDGEDAEALFEGLRNNDLMNYTHVLTGYVVSESFLLKVVDVVKELKAHNPGLVYVCDPVMGDNGRLYVKERIVPIYRDVIIHLADIITPNQTELELLTGTKISCESEALSAIEMLHVKGVPTVVLSSSELGDTQSLLCLASQRKGGRTKKYRLKMPKLDDYFVGTGDLFAASLLAWMDKDQDLKSALEKTVSIVQAVLERTLCYAKSLAGPDAKLSMRQKELRLIQSRADIENPQVVLWAEEVV